jgi:hypothetical protein
VTEIAHALNGTAFKPLGTFYLGSLLPDYAAAFATDEVAQDFSFDSGGDDLDISMDAVGDFGEVPDLPGDEADTQFALSAADIPDFDGDDLSLEGHDIPDMDLSGFDADSGRQGESHEEYALDDVPEFDLAGIEFEEDADLEMAGPTPDLSDIDLSLGEDELAMAADNDEGMVDLADLEMESDSKAKDKGRAELPDLEL